MPIKKTTTRFWLRTDTISEEGGPASIHLVYQIRGQRRTFSVSGVKILPINWSMQAQKAVYIDKKKARKQRSLVNEDLLLTSVEVQEVNSKLSEILTEVRNIETRYKLDNVTYSPTMVISGLKKHIRPEGKKDDPSHSVVDFVKKISKDFVGRKQPGTLKVYTGLAAHLSDYEKQTGDKVTFNNIDLAFMRRLETYFSEPKYRSSKNGKTYKASMNNITAAKQISTLKTLLNYARTDYGYQVNQSYRDFKVSRKDSDFEVITLTQDEFLTIYNFDLSENRRLDNVRDVFCFACATGLRFSDLQQLRNEHIRNDNTIHMTAAKTGQKLVIPLNPFSHSILQKYSGKLRPLPLISNQKLNDYIKELGELACIDTPIEKVRMRGVKKVQKTFKKYELLSIHVGRKSFITLSLEKGIAIQEVMSLSGHTTFKAFKRYVDVSENRKKTVMAQAWGIVNPLKVAK